MCVCVCGCACGVVCVCMWCVCACGVCVHVVCVCMWCGVVWCGVVWCGVVWCGVVWCGVVWCGVRVYNVYTMPCMYTNLQWSVRLGTCTLQRLHGHFRGIHIVIFCKKIFKDLLFFIFSGT